MLRYNNKNITIILYLYKGYISINNIGINSASLIKTTYITIIFKLKAKVSF